MPSGDVVFRAMKDTFAGTVAAMAAIIAAKDETIEAKQEVIRMQIMVIEDLKAK